MLKGCSHSLNLNRLHCAITFCNWQKVALCVAFVFTILAISGLCAHFLPPSAVYTLGGTAGTIVLLTAISYLIVRKKAQVNIDENNTISQDTQITLSWEDVMFILSQDSPGFGLRHVDKNSVEHELNEGFYGDALNLDITRDVYGKFFPQDDYDTLLLWPGRAAKDKKKTLIKFWENGVNSFINKSLKGSDSAFFLISYGSDYKNGAYDLNRYGNGLGKKGKSHVRANQITLLPNPSSHLSRKEVIAHYHSALIKAIHDFRKSF